MHCTSDTCKTTNKISRSTCTRKLSKMNAEYNIILNGVYKILSRLIILFHGGHTN